VDKRIEKYGKMGFWDELPVTADVTT